MGAKKENVITRTDPPEQDSQKVFSVLGAFNLKNWLVTNYTTLMNNIRETLEAKISTKLSHGEYSGTDKALFDLIKSNLSKLENLERKCSYRVGDVLTTENKEHSTLTWQGTTWTKIEAIFLRGTEAGQSAGVVSGSNTVTLKIGNLPPYNHLISVILGDSGIHRHQVDNHIPSQPSHTHLVGMGNRGNGRSNSVCGLDSSIGA